MALQTMAIQLSYVDYVLKQNTSLLTHAESMQTPQEGGNCINWILGHILATRNGFLQILGEKTVLTEDKALLYQRGSTPLVDSGGVIPLEELLELLQSSHNLMLKKLQQTDPARLSEPAPFSPLGKPGETVGSLLAGLIFHDSYHSGQTGILRHILGKEGRLT